MEYSKKLQNFFRKTNMSKTLFSELSGISKTQINNLLYRRQKFNDDLKMQADIVFNEKENWVFREKAIRCDVKKDLDAGFRVCKVCNEKKSYLRTRDVCRTYYIDLKFKRWNGHTCPDCWREFMRKRY